MGQKGSKQARKNVHVSTSTLRQTATPVHKEDQDSAVSNVKRTLYVHVITIPEDVFSEAALASKRGVRLEDIKKGEVTIVGKLADKQQAFKYMIEGEALKIQKAMIDSYEVDYHKWGCDCTAATEPVVSEEVGDTIKSRMHEYPCYFNAYKVMSADSQGRLVGK